MTAPLRHQPYAKQACVVVIVRTADGDVVLTVHRKYKGAVALARLIAPAIPHRDVGVASIWLWGPRGPNSYSAGDVVDPRHKVFSRMAGRKSGLPMCDECCSNYRPTGLSYKCPVDGGTCAAVAAVIVGKDGTPSTITGNRGAPCT